MIADVIALIELLKKGKERYDILSALFDADGARLEGDARIQVGKVPVVDRANQWYYSITPVDGYVFVYMPVIPTVYVDFGALQGDAIPDARYFRFVGNPMSAFAGGGLPNVRVQFMVVGYKPKDLLGRAENA